jgi:type IV secretion system protein VirB10
MSVILTSVLAAAAQDPRIALQRGYRTGYSDGYMAGYRDSIDNETKSYSRHAEYTEARRAFNEDYGKLEDYSDGYRQGFEAGYETGFEKRSFESAIPGDLARRQNADPIEPPPAVTETTDTTETTETTEYANDPISEPPMDAAIPETEIAETQTAPATTTTTPETAAVTTADTTTADDSQTYSTPAATPVMQKASYTRDDDAIIIIPRDTELIIEIQQELSTERNRAGDTFTARIVSPYEIEGATIEGRIERITKPGRIKRRAEMLLSFDRIVLSEDRWSNFSAIVTEVVPVKGDNVKTVDGEGTAIGKRSVKDDAIKIGASTGAGLGIGALTGGPVGAAVGASVGAAFGVGAVVIERGKDIKLNQNQQLRIRTAYETKIR